MIREIEVEEDICDNPMPKNMSAYYAHLSGAYVASCDNCKYVSAYWECACELMHDCEEYR